ncbi:MAG: MBL fold metallo-hydrolase [Clostridia bacterium]|nr:MBL fold metallo-hydrolase [Clostridia bacterium]
MRLTALKYGETTLSEAMVFRGGKQGRMLPISLTLYLIETEGRRILVDAGCDTMPGFALTHFCGPVAVLTQAGIAPDEVTDVILTHRHHDHAEGARHFPGARFWIQAEELPGCRKFLPPDADVQLFEEQTQVCAGVVARRIGGHTAGSSIVEVTGGGQIYVICGDECYSPLCLERGIPTGASCCPERSEAFLETYRDPRYRVLLAHDDRILSGRNGAFRIVES